MKFYFFAITNLNPGSFTFRNGNDTWRETTKISSNSIVRFINMDSGYIICYVSDATIVPSGISGEAGDWKCTRPSIRWWECSMDKNARAVSQIYKNSVKCITGSWQIVFHQDARRHRELVSQGEGLVRTVSLDFILAWWNANDFDES